MIECNDWKLRWSNMENLSKVLAFTTIDLIHHLVEDTVREASGCLLNVSLDQIV